jgi:DNA gyrase subunit A
MIKKTEFLAYNTPIKADGIIAINIKKGDELVDVRMTSGKDDIIMISKSGHASRFNEKLARPMGRGTAGVKGMNVSQKGNKLLAMDVARDDTDLFVVTENGYGKRSPMTEYPVKGRGTMGVLTIKMTSKKGELAGAMIVREHQDLVFISQNGMVQRTGAKGISTMGRATQGVRVMNLREKDRVSAVALVVESTADPKVDGNGAPPDQELLEGEVEALTEGDDAVAEEETPAEPTPKSSSKPKAKPAAKPKAKRKK